MIVHMIRLQYDSVDDYIHLEIYIHTNINIVSYVLCTDTNHVHYFADQPKFAIKFVDAVPVAILSVAKNQPKRSLILLKLEVI